MRLKLSFKRPAKHAWFPSLACLLIIAGCSTEITPTYREKDIPYQVKKICKEEYSLDVVTTRTSTTLWIYAPVDKILHAEYGTNEEKFFDDSISEKFRNILTTIGRVIVSADTTPEFYALIASDIKLGIDYIMIGSTLDLKKSYAGILPWPEANRRYVMDLKPSPESIGDTQGEHFTAYDITLPNFLAAQIAQRIGMRFRDVDCKDYFKVEKSEGGFLNGAFEFDYSITQLSIPPKNIDIDIEREAFAIVAYCLRTYEFTQFSEVRFNNLTTGNKVVLNQKALWDFLR